MRQLQIKISLANSHIPIWRRFQITDDYRLDRFHQVIQIVMGWWNSHLHEFEIGGRRFGMLLNDNLDLPGTEDETRFYLKNFPFKVGQELNYLYDFGDNWLHHLVVESIDEGKKSMVKCLEGSGRCPLEDIGGVGGYEFALQAEKDPKHPQHAQFLGDRWINELPDYTLFNIKEVNREIRKFSLWQNKHPRKKSTPWHQLTG